MDAIFSLLQNILFLVSLLSSVLFSVIASPGQNETDKLALLVLKDGLIHGSRDALASWNDSIEFCEWPGVKCGHRHRRVTILQLNSLKLTGSISPVIGNLTFLREITLSDNSLDGIIPPEIGRLRRLQFLNLSRNNLKGHLPVELTNCSSLQFIILSYNNLTGNLPLQFGHMSQLVRLSLGINSFVGTIPHSLGNLSSLVHLSLPWNNFQGTIPFSLGSVVNLNILSFAINNLSGQVPISIFNLSSLIVLDMGSNNLSGSLPHYLDLAFPNLQNLYMANNHFTGPIPAPMVNISSLKIVEMAVNYFTGFVPESLGNLVNLQMLNLFGNQLDGHLNFLSSLSNCTQLDSLYLHINQFSGSLPVAVGNLSSQLRLLFIGRNQISGTIPEGISNLSGLTLLDLGLNLLSGTIPAAIGKLENLQRLFLYANDLHSKIPSSVGNLSRLFDLHLHVNSFEGSIPTSLRNCTNLQNLRFYGNKLTGSIPNQMFASFQRLVIFHIFENSLSGSIPTDIGSLSNLVELDISGNNFSGEIPMELGSCTGLKLLNMENNFFRGTIPSSFHTLKSLETLDLSQNNLSGAIPHQLQDLPYLIQLNLSFNNLEGEVPIQGVFKNASAVSIMGNNKLCGGVLEMHLARCIIGKEKKGNVSSLKVILAIIISILLGLIATVVLIMVCLRRNPRIKPAFAFFSGDGHPRVSYKDLFQATNGFASFNLIGTGSFGSVFKGVLPQSEKSVAVKVLNLQNSRAAKSFMAECKTLGKVRHRNLLNIVTACSSIDYKGNDFMALVFDFMPNGNLDSWLHFYERNESRNLTLIQRLDLAIDVANALDYLDYHCEPSIVHCDLKPSNVLLDDDMVTHVGDFGLAKLLSSTALDNQSTDQSSSSMIKGTIGYVAPEYGMGGTASAEGDMYSYGILVLEMLTAKRPTNEIFHDGLNLHSMCKMALPEKIWDIMDPRLLQQFNYMVNEHDIRGRIWECLVSFVRVGVSCSAEFPGERMNIKDVITELCKAKAKLLQAGTNSRVRN